MFRTALLELWRIPPSTHISLLQERVCHWFPIMHRSVFKTAILMYKFLHSGYPKYFEPFLRMHRSQSDGVLLEAHIFASIYKSKKHFGLSFTFDAPRIWNDLPDDVCSAKSLSLFMNKLKTYLFEKAYPPYFSPSLVIIFLCGADP